METAALLSVAGWSAAPGGNAAAVRLFGTDLLTVRIGWMGDVCVDSAKPRLSGPILRILVADLSGDLSQGFCVEFEGKRRAGARLLLWP